MFPQDQSFRSNQQFYKGARVWGVVKCFQIDCNFTGPLGDLTGKDDQPSGKSDHRKGTRQ